MANNQFLDWVNKKKENSGYRTSSNTSNRTTFTSETNGSQFDNWISSMGLHDATERTGLYDVYNEERRASVRQNKENYRSSDYEKYRIGWLGDSSDDKYNSAEMIKARGDYYANNTAQITALKDQIKKASGDEKKNLEKQMEALEAENRQYERTQMVSDRYNSLTSNADFETSSKKRDYENPTREDFENYDIRMSNGITYDANGVGRDVFGDVFDENYYDRFKEPEVLDRLGLYLGTDKKTRQEAYANATEGSWDSIIKDGEDGSWDKLTENEIGVYYYLLANSGKESADRYLDEMKTELNRRATYERSENISRLMDEGTALEKIALNVASVPTNVIGGAIGFTEDVFNTATGKDINPYSYAHDFTNFAQAVRSSTAENIDETFGGAEIPYVEFGVDDAYQAFMSGADSLVGAGLLGKGYTAFMGMSAASTEARDLYENGASDTQIALGALTAGTAEAMFEYISLDKLLSTKTPNGMKELVGQVLAQAGVEASEEMATEIANTFTNALIMRSQSEWSKLYDEGGFKEAFLGTLSEVINAGIGGFVSGGAMAGARSGMNLLGYNSNMTGYGRELYNDGGIHTLVDYGKNNDISKRSQNLLGIAEESLGKDKLGRKDYRNIGKYADSLNAETIENATKSEISERLLKENLPNDQKTVDSIYNYITNDSDIKIASKDIRTLANQMINSDDFNSSVAMRTLNSRMNMVQEHATRVKEDETSQKLQEEYGDKVSDTGETVVASTGEKVSISNIASIDNGVMILNTSDGKTVNSNDIIYASTEEALVYESIKALGCSSDVGNYILTALKSSNLGANAFMNNVSLAFNYGMTNQQKRLSSLMIPEELRNQLFKEGRISASKIASKMTSDTKGRTASAKKSDGVTFVNDIDENTLNDKQMTTVKVARYLSRATSLDINIYESYKRDGKTYINIDGVEHQSSANGWFVTGTNKIYIDINAGNDYSGLGLFTLAHESGHYIRDWNAEAWKTLADLIVEEIDNQAEADSSKPTFEQLVANKYNKYATQRTREENLIKEGKLDRGDYSGKTNEELSDMAYEDVICDSLASLMADKETFTEFSNQLKEKDNRVWTKLKNFIKRFLKKLDDILASFNGVQAEDYAGQAIQNATKEIRDQIRELYVSAFIGADANYNSAVNNAEQNIADVGLVLDENTESVAPGVLNSERTWNESDYVQAREQAAKDMAGVLGISVKKAMAYIDSVNSIAKMIASDRERLDYEPSEGVSSFVSNTEYGGSIDFSTICKKRRLLTGTFSAIQKALPNTALTAEEILTIRKMMDDKGYEVSCGLCYVEGSRARMGEYAKEFLDQYAKTNPEYLPNMAEINTPEGIEKIRIEHPEIYKEYQAFMNKLAQRKPKLYQMATEYQGEILTKFKKSDSVEEKNRNGGLRLQSFSDFEIIHLIDCMQVIMDMSRVGLAGQAYTKVADFAYALGNTGLKINLSLIAKGVDENGHLILDEKEGMKKSDAQKLRNMYSDNVGTILVVFNDEQLMSALSDEFIDFIIPFHRSQWNSKQYELMGLPENAKDYTKWQNESYIVPVFNKNGKKLRPDNYMPNTYWDFSKTGKENAEAYLAMCAMNNRLPKFSHLLVNNGDGSYSLQPDGSTDGYWKLLIDFKMYNNDGVGVPQRAVTPNFNMVEAVRMLNEYNGGHQQFPVAQDIVDEFLAKKSKERGVDESDSRKMSDRETEQYISKSNKKYGDVEKAAIEHFGTTDDFRIAGYILRDGSMLDFSGVHWLDGSSPSYIADWKKKNDIRQVDHEDIYEAFEISADDFPSDSRKEFINRGNIRVSPEAPGINIASEPTSEQYQVIRELIIDNPYNVQGFYVDIENKSKRIEKLSYSGKVNADRVINDIKYFYANGSVRKPSEIMQFHTSYGEDVKYSIREEEPPKKTIKGYKVFFVKDGKLYPPMVANPNGSDTPVGVWLNADIGTQAPDSKTGRKQVKAGGKGTQGGSGSLAFRPGWHLGEIPLATQFDRTNPKTGVKELFPENFVWAECDIAADIDYQEEAMSYGYNKNGKFQHSLAGLPKIPTDGYYRYRTNPNPDTVPWLITGAMKVNRLLSDEEVNKILAENGIAPKQRQGGNKTLEDLGLSQYTSSDDIRYSVRINSNGDELTEDQSKFFANTKVVDSKGRLLIVYHGTPDGGFTIFNPSESDFKEYTSVANWFTTNIGMIEKYYSVDNSRSINGKQLYEVYLNMTKPLIVDANGDAWHSIKLPKELQGLGIHMSRHLLTRELIDLPYARTEDIAKYAKSKGYDGVIIRNVRDGSAYENTSDVYAVFESNQIKNVDNEHPTSDPDIRYSDRDSYAPTFYSKMSQVIDGIKTEKVGAGGVVPYLKGKGVKDEEIKWSGIQAFLEGKKSVTKEELQDFAKGSMLQIEETTLIDYSSGDTTSLDKLNYFLDEYGIRVAEDDFINEMDNSFNHAYFEESMKEYYDDGDLTKEQYDKLIEISRNVKIGNETHWSEYVTKGAKNYREILFKIPGSDYSNNAMEAHWQESGVIAHARIDDMVLLDGSKMLFIEEIQSDWHNQGRKKGYGDKSKETPRFIIRDMGEDAYMPFGIYDTREDKIVRWDTTLTELKIYADFYNNKYKSKKAPDAPFKTTYTDFVMKRLIRIAAEEGYDYIGWTTGEMQEERWSSEYAEGYRIEYDQDIPKFMNKYGKQWGGMVSTSILDESGNTVHSFEITPSMKKSVLYEGQVLYSDRENATDTRTILSNALASTAQNEIEKKYISQYQEKISTINEEQVKLKEIRAKIKELSFAKGHRDADQIRRLQDEATKTANRINTFDKQLLKLEATKPLMAVIEREKAMAKKKALKEGREALDAYRQRATETQRALVDKYQARIERTKEGREKTELRHKIIRKVKELNDLLLKGDANRHVPIALQKSTADALSAINMDTVNAEERIAKIREKMSNSSDPDVIEIYQKSIERIELQGENMKAKLDALDKAYSEIKNSNDPLIANSYDDGIQNMISEIREDVGDTPLREMTKSQLEMVYDMYKAVLHTIRTSNKAFKLARQESITELGNKVANQIMLTGGKKKFTIKALSSIKEFLWDNLKPVYAMKALGSETFSELFDNVRAGEDTWAVDVSEARDYFLEVSRKHGYKSWDFDTRYEYTSKTGKKFSLNLQEIMSLYAFSKREQAALHLSMGGFVFEDSTVVKKVKGVPVEYKVNIADAHNVSEQLLDDIISRLTPEQKAFVDEMQSYMSTVLSAKGNEVSRALYDIDLFKEKNYFPLKSARQYMFEQNEVAGEVKIKNSGFTKRTVKKANNPIVLRGFMDVWSSHVNDMAMYHAFVLPLEDFNRVWNYRTPTADNLPTESVKMVIQNAYGEQANAYIKQMLTDLNGGARSGTGAGLVNKMTALFKKGAVFASASVVVQQPSAIARAWAYIDPKYFGKTITSAWNPKTHEALWKEVKKYAPVAIIKEMGYFDTNMGKQTTDSIRQSMKESEKTQAIVKDSNYRDDVLSKAAALADEMSWVHIWNAVKEEMAESSNLPVGSEEFLKACGKRFTDVIVNTQVYDSVLSRSALMRSKDTGVKMATAFMAEPTTSINMISDALLQAKRSGNGKQARRVIGAVIGQIILNSILVSLVYAGRDDDDDKTYAEKYVKAITGALADSINPMAMIPYLRDVKSIVEGYDVERSDMSVVSGIVNGWNILFKDNYSPWKKVETFAGSIANLFGLPLKNIMRDVRGMYNTVNTLISDNETTASGIKYAAIEGITGDSKKTQIKNKLMSSLDGSDFENISGCTKELIDYNMNSGKSEKDARTAVKTQVTTELKPRYIESYRNKDNDEMLRIRKAMKATGLYDDVVKTTQDWIKKSNQ